MHRCPSCGAEVEMFSDEMRVRCHVCKNFVCKDTVPTCISWCAKARECLGEERWRALHPEDYERPDDSDDAPGDSGDVAAASGEPVPQEEGSGV